MPHDKLLHDGKVYKCTQTIVSVTSCYKEAEPLTSKDSAEVAKAFQLIYKRCPLTWQQMLQIDPGRKFMGSVTKEMENHRRPEIHRDQAIVECFNRTLARTLVWASVSRGDAAALWPAVDCLAQKATRHCCRSQK